MILSENSVDNYIQKVPIESQKIVILNCDKLVLDNHVQGAGLEGEMCDEKRVKSAHMF